MRTLRFAIIGCGVISKNHALSVLENGGEVVACSDSIEESAKAFAEEYGLQWYTDYKEMLKRDDIDVVSICTPSGMHAEMTIEASKSGKHVIVEKPMDINLESADQMIRACQDNGVKLSIISQHRFDESTLAVKQAIEDGKFGNLVLGNASVLWYRTQAYYDSGEWRGTWALDGGGALMNQSIHTIDLLQYLMGDIEEIYAHTATLAHERIEVEDVATATLRFKNGALGTIVGTTCATPGLSAKLEIFGQTGSAVIDGDKLVHYHNMNTPEENPLNGFEEEKETGGASTAAINYRAHKKQIKDMMDAIIEDREPIVNGKEGRKPLEIILAIYESARTGQPVKFS